MWNILKCLPEIFKQARNRGYENEIPMTIFRSEMKRVTGVMTDKTINNWLKSLQELGYIKAKGTGVVELCPDVNKPYQFLSDEMDKRLIAEEAKERLKSIQVAKVIKE